MAKGKAKAGGEVPRSAEAEQAVLGAILLTSGRALDEVLELIAGSDFYEERHRLIWVGMQGLAQQRVAVDLVTLSERLKAAGTLADVGGAAYLSELSDLATTAANVVYHAKLVRDRAIQRELIRAGLEIATECESSRDAPATLLDRAEGKLSAIHRPGGREVAPIADLLQEAFGRIEKAHESGREIVGLGTGLPDLDRPLAGLEEGDLILLGARPGAGKTALGLLFLLETCVEQKLPAVLFSLEMSRAQITDRLLATRASVDLAAMRGGKLAKHDLPKVAKASGDLHDAPLMVDDTPGITPLALRAKARRLKRRKEGLALIVVDYVQLMRGEGDSPEQQVSECSQSLKELARELSVPVVLLSQLSRDVEKRKPPIPRPSDLRQSGSLEQDADKILFIYRPALYYQKARDERPNEAQILIGKNRNGPAGLAVKTYFDGPRATFRSWTNEDEPGGPVGNYQEADR